MGAAVEEVADDVFRGRGTDVNFYLVRDGDRLTLFDAGYPGDAGTVLAAIRSLGRDPRDVAAVLITHAHVDHIGAANVLHREYGVPALTGVAEVRHAHREHLEQPGPLEVARVLWRPATLPWVLRIARRGALSRAAVPHAEGVADGAPLDLPGRPVPIATAGHTSGHTAFHLPDMEAVVTGDALVTGHALLPTTGPQLLPAMFQHGDARAGLRPLADLDAALILPGHGEPVRQPIGDAVRSALRG